MADNTSVTTSPVRYSTPANLGTLPPELEELKHLAREVVQKECIPLETKFLTHRLGDKDDPEGGAWIETPSSRNEEAVDGALPKADWDRLTKVAKETGLYTATLPEEYGGLQYGVLGSFVLAEELKRSIVPLPIPEVPPVLFNCNEEQRKKYLEPTISGELLVLLRSDRTRCGVRPGRDAHSRGTRR